MSTNGRHRYPHRVAVTGIGIVSPLGTGADAFWRAAAAGTVATRALTRFDASAYPSRVAAEIDGFEPANFMTRKRAHWTERFAQFAVAGARLALDDAGFGGDGAASDFGIWIGSALGGVAYGEEQHDRFREGGLRAIHPLLAIAVFGGTATTNVALEFGIRGPNVANANSCAAGTVAIGEAFRAVARGEVPAALAGGVEAPLSPLVYGAFAVIRAMSARNDEPERASRPFDAGRDGFVMAEGSGMLLLERYDRAVARGAHLYGEVLGFGLSGDAHHMTAPRPDGTSSAAAMRAALAEAQVAADEIELFDAHGSSSELNDLTESLAFGLVFGERSARIPVAASKGQHGHALGATGAWEAALTLLAMERASVPGLPNLDDPDPRCALDVARATRPHRAGRALSNSSGFGGINAALVLGRAE